MKAQRQKYLITGGFLLAAAIFIVIGITSKGNNSEESFTETMFPQGYKIVQPHIPENLSFAGETVPMDNYEVYERIDREFISNTYFHSATLLSLKRAKRFFPIIEPILRKNNIPEDFKYLPIVESTLSNAISPAGAVGVWQIMESSGKEYGLEINSEVDERYHLEKSTEVAVKYLKDAYAKFGSWTIAAAAYNMGQNGMRKQLDRQKANNYYNLVLSDETSRYIARIVVIKEIIKNPSVYGYSLQDEELYSPLETKDITVNYSIDNLASFAAEQGINYKILKMYNPWLRDNRLTNLKGKNYIIKLPVEGSIKIIR